MVLAAVAQDGRALCYASETLRGDREVVLTAVAKNGGALQFASAELRGDREVVLTAVAQNGHALQHASETLRGDREVVLEAVAQNGWALEHASETLRADREVVLAAVAQNGHALQHASAELHTDKENILKEAASIRVINSFIESSDEDFYKPFGRRIKDVLDKDGEAGVNKLFQMCLKYMNKAHERKGINRIDYNEKYRCLCEVVAKYYDEERVPDQKKFINKPQLELKITLNKLMASTLCGEYAQTVFNGLGLMQSQRDMGNEPLLWDHFYLSPTVQEFREEVSDNLFLEPNCSLAELKSIKLSLDQFEQIKSYFFDNLIDENGEAVGAGFAHGDDSTAGAAATGASSTSFLFSAAAEAAEPEPEAARAEAAEAEAARAEAAP